jgi:hypothetical protein
VDEGGRDESPYGSGIELVASMRPPQNRYYRMCEGKVDRYLTLLVMSNKVGVRFWGGRMDVDLPIRALSCDYARPPSSTPPTLNPVHITEVIQ